MDAIRKKFPNHTELAYREAVSKLKYFLAESYAPRSVVISKPFYTGKRPYRDNNNAVDDYIEDIGDSQSIASEASKRDPSTRGGGKYNYASRLSSLPPSGTTTTGMVVPAANEKSLVPAPPPTELLSFIERQEEYIEQLERESQYCKDELKGLLEKVKEVVAENETLQEKYKSANLMKTVLDSWPDNPQLGEEVVGIAKSPTSSATLTPATATARKTVPKPLEGPAIVFESRISELEAQLTQARLELRKAREESQANLERLTELTRQDEQQTPRIPQLEYELERTSRERRELEAKLEELQRDLEKSKDRDAEAEARSRRAAEQARQAEAEVRRLRDELERRQDKLREALQESNRRIAEEKQQIERRMSQQMEAELSSHWEAASKSHLESEKQRREIVDLKRELAQKQAYIEDLKKEMQVKASKMQEELNEAIAQKDASQDEVATVKLAAERSERQARQEQARLQAEINSYKLRLEKADADLMHARRENLRLAEEVAALEKEINMNKLVSETRVGGQPSPKPDKSKEDRDRDKELASLISDLESKQAKTIGNLEDSLNKQASLVSRLTAECQSLTQRLEDNDQKHKKEMESLQNNIDFLSTKMKNSLELGERDAGELEKPIASSSSGQNSSRQNDNVNNYENYNLGQDSHQSENENADALAYATAQPTGNDEEKYSEQHQQQQQQDTNNYHHQHYNQYEQYEQNQYPEYFSEQQFSGDNPTSYAEDQQYPVQAEQYLDKEPYNEQNYNDYVNNKQEN